MTPTPRSSCRGQSRSSESCHPPTPAAGRVLGCGGETGPPPREPGRAAAAATAALCRAEQTHHRESDRHYLKPDDSSLGVCLVTPVPCLSHKPRETPKGRDGPSLCQPLGQTPSAYRWEWTPDAHTGDCGAGVSCPVTPGTRHRPPHSPPPADGEGIIVQAWVSG